MDTRTDDYIGTVEVRSDDNEEIKSIDLYAHQFRVRDATGEVDFADGGVCDDLLEQVREAILLSAHHELSPPAEQPPATH